MQMMAKWAVLLTGGVLGTAARYIMSNAVYKMTGPKFPFGTLTVNLLGCLFVGFVAGLGEQKMALSPEAKLFLITGFCGAFTTFSALILETAGLTKSGNVPLALFNVFIQIVLGYFLFRAGMAVSELL
jgi:fluoride exporter